jgi:hypothetical protein|tara:strand:+ start:2990 stop:3238 length:249 start_codon:yes stop_codon:yes gene_type:complete
MSSRSSVQKRARANVVVVSRSGRLERGRVGILGTRFVMTLGRRRERADEGTMETHRRRRDARVRDRDETAKETRGRSSVKHD